MRGDEAAQYSAWLFLYWEISSLVGAADRAALAAALAPGPRADVAAVVDRIRRGQLPRLRAISWAAYDQYLKANRVEEGVRSYDAVITLLARARFTDNWVPVLRDRGRRKARPGPTSRSAAADDAAGRRAPETIADRRARPSSRRQRAGEDFVHAGGVELAQRGIEPRRDGRGVARRAQGRPDHIEPGQQVVVGEQHPDPPSGGPRQPGVVRQALQRRARRPS